MDKAGLKAELDWLLNWIFRKEGVEGLAAAGRAWEKEWKRRQRQAAKKAEAEKGWEGE